MVVVERPAVRDVGAHHPHAAAGGGEQARLVVRRLTVGEAGDDVVEPHPADDRHAVPAPLAVVRALVAEGGEGHRREGGVGQLRLLHADDVGLALGQPLLHPLLAGLERVHVPRHEAHDLGRYRPLRRRLTEWG